MDILHAQFNNGRLSLEEIKTCLGADFGTAWPTIQKKFKQDEKGLFFNERLEAEKEKRKSFTESRRKNLTPKAHTATHMKDHMEPHMENENEDVNDIKNDFIMVSEKKVFDPLTIIEYFQAQLNGMMREHNNLAWRPLIPAWFNEHLGEDFKDEQHVKNSFKRFYMSQKPNRAGKKSMTAEEILAKIPK